MTPSAYRKQLDGALSPDQSFACGGEVEAIAWSFAAATAIGMPLSELFHPAGYRGQAPGLAMNFALGVYPGVHGLIGAGLAANLTANQDALRSLGEAECRTCRPNLHRGQDTLRSLGEGG